MSTHDRRTRDLIADQAAAWILENRTGLDARQRREFVAWLKASPVHVEEFLALIALTQDIRSACGPTLEAAEGMVAQAEGEPELGTVSPLHSDFRAAGSSRHGSRAIRVVLAASLAIMTVGALFYTLLPPRPLTAAMTEEGVQHLRTGRGQQRTYRLADRSIVHLNTDTEIAVRFTGAERLVVIDAGEAFFEVAHLPGRRFRVSAGSAQVLDLGTKFDVRQDLSGTWVTVAAGEVDVALTHDSGRTPQTLRVAEGQQVHVAAGPLPARSTPVDVDRATAWLHGQIEFDNEPLGQVTEQFNRYTATPIEIDTPALRSLRISGVFATDNGDAFVAFLRRLPGVRVRATKTAIHVSAVDSKGT